MDRKRALSLVLSQTRQQERRDEEVFDFPPFKLVICILLPSLYIQRKSGKYRNLLLYFMQVLAEAKRIAESRILTKVIFKDCISMTLIITGGEEEGLL